jgi:hypothetical protein
MNNYHTIAYEEQMQADVVRQRLELLADSAFAHEAVSDTDRLIKATDTRQFWLSSAQLKKALASQ